MGAPGMGMAAGMGTRTSAPAAGMGGPAVGMGGAAGMGRSSDKEGAFIACSVFGDVKVIRGGRTIKLEAPKEGSDPIALEDGDRIITGSGSYAWGISGPGMVGVDEGANIALFPNSEAVIHSNSAHRIISLDLLKGLFSVSVTTNGKIENALHLPSGYPLPEFKPLFGEFKKTKSIAGFIELGSDGSVTYFNFVNRILLNGLEPEDRTQFFNGKFVIKGNALYATNLNRNPDPRCAAAKDILMTLASQYLSADPLKKALEWLENNPPGAFGTENISAWVKVQRDEVKKAEETGDPSLIALAKRSLEIAKKAKGPSQAEIAEEEKEYERKKEATRKMIAKVPETLAKLRAPFPQYLPVRDVDRVTKKDVVRKAKNYDQIMDEQQNMGDQLAEKYKINARATPGDIMAYVSGKTKSQDDMKKKVMELINQKGLTAMTKSADMNASFSYQKADYTVFRVEKGTEHKFARAPSGTEFLVVFMRISNNTKSEIFISPDQSFSLLADGQQIALGNYTFATNLDPGKTTEGYAFFKVPENARKFVFMAGNKSEKKQNVDLVL